MSTGFNLRHTYLFFLPGKKLHPANTEFPRSHTATGEGRACVVYYEDGSILTAPLRCLCTPCLASLFFFFFKTSPFRTTTAGRWDTAPRSSANGRRAGPARFHGGVKSPPPFGAASLVLAHRNYVPTAEVVSKRNTRCCVQYRVLLRPCQPEMDPRGRHV